MSLIDRLTSTLPAGAVVTGEAARERAFSPWTRLGAPLAIAYPRSTAEVSQILRLAHAAQTVVVPWGGRTGLVEGANAEGALALSLERMNQVERIDPVGATLTGQAGCPLAVACDAAREQGLLLPLDLGSRGSATLGGVISTNAGGNRVLRYGMTRDMVLGLEAVLADGTVISALNPLIKNNTGYDLKQLFIGSEGTLGVVTRAVFRLRQAPGSQETALLAVDSFDALPRLLRRLEADLAGALSAFEVMWPEFYALVTTPPALGRAPLPPGAGYYVLIEALGGEPEGDRLRFEQALQRALAAGEAADAVLARSQAERDRLWGLRDDVAQTARNGPILAFDVSLRIDEMEGYVGDLRRALTDRWPAITLTVFGHLGDGNLHLIAGPVPAGAGPEVAGVVYGELQARGGSISAEHGIGLQKRDYLAFSRSPEEIALMRRLKAALDPSDILNRGKVLAPPPLQS